MIGRGLFILTLLSNCVTSSQLENEDVEVMKCIVEVLADVLSRPHVMPVSKECLVTLKTDDRLVKILRHQKFLKELQEIAVQGNHKRAQLQRDAVTPSPMTQTLPTANNIADRSMLEALGGPGERSILSQKERTGNGDGMEDKNDGVEDEQSQDEDEVEEVQVKRGNEEDKAEKTEEESEEKRANPENLSKDEQGDVHNNGHRQKKVMHSGEDGEEDQRSALFSHIRKEEAEEEVKRGSRESLKRWTKRAKSLSLKRKAALEEAQRDIPHHSKEVVEKGEEEEEEKKKRDSQRSPEERELQMIAHRSPEERKGLEEEGSASRKSEEPEIESLAAIESELENVAQKLHELRRG